MFAILRNSPIGVKVAVAPGLAILCLVVVTLLSWVTSRHLGAELQRVGVDGSERVAHAQSYATQMTELHQVLYQSLTWEAIGQRAEKITELDDKLTKQLAEFNKTLKAAAADTTLSEEQRSSMASLAKGFEAYGKIAVDTLDMKSAGVANAASYVVALDNQYRENKALALKFVQVFLADGRRDAEGAQLSAGRQGNALLAVSLLALVVCGAVAWHSSRAITMPLTTAAQVAGSMAQGDFTSDIAPGSNDATGRLLAALQEVSQSLNGIVSEVRSTADEINTASTEIASGNADLSVRTERTAGALQQTASSIEQLSAAIRQSAANADEANRLARDAAHVAQEGGNAVRDVVVTMDAINAQAKKIGEINGVIDGIAFQTNILALNAAVEAARAGEQGRGFSVVAQEVRHLAQRSAEAAREIRTLISSSVQQIGVGVAQAQSAGQTMERIVEAIGDVSRTVDDIARASVEQASGVTQVNVAVGEMDTSTQQNAAMVEQASAATESLRMQAIRLVTLLQKFRTAPATA